VAHGAADSRIAHGMGHALARIGIGPQSRLELQVEHIVEQHKLGLIMTISTLIMTISTLVASLLPLS
jgi:hypothetical protein